MLLFLTLILNISIGSFSSSWNRLNALSTCRKIVPIDIAQNLEIRLCWMKLFRSVNHYITTSLIKVRLLNSCIQLILKIQNILLTDAITLITWISCNIGIETEEKKSTISLITPLFIHLQTNNRCLENFFNKLQYLIFFTKISLIFYEVHLVEG